MTIGKRDLPGVSSSELLGVSLVPGRQSRDGSKPEVVPSDHSRFILTPSRLLNLVRTSQRPLIMFSQKIAQQSLRRRMFLLSYDRPRDASSTDNLFPITVAVQQPLAMQSAMMRASPAAVALGKGIQSRFVHSQPGSSQQLPAGLQYRQPHKDRRHPQFRD